MFSPQPTLRSISPMYVPTEGRFQENPRLQHPSRFACFETTGPNESPGDAGMHQLSWEDNESVAGGFWNFGRLLSLLGRLYCGPRT